MPILRTWTDMSWHQNRRGYPQSLPRWAWWLRGPMTSFLYVTWSPFFCSKYVVQQIEFWAFVFLETGQFYSKPFKLDKPAKSSILGLLNPNFGLNAWASFSPRQWSCMIQSKVAIINHYQPMYAEKKMISLIGYPILMVDHHFNVIRVWWWCSSCSATCIRASDASDSFHMDVLEDFDRKPLAEVFPPWNL